MRPIKYDSVIDTPIGRVGVVTANNRLERVSFLSPRSVLIPPKNVLVAKIVSELKKYFCDPKQKFTLPLSFLGTPLQIKIWRALQKIPVGSTTTYGRLAAKIGTNPRVVGNASRANPLPVIVPCHRVVAALDVGGFCGKTSGSKLEIKKWLLDHECAV